MHRSQVVRNIVFLALPLLLCCVNYSGRVGVAQTPESSKEEKMHLQSISELRHVYESAKSQYERRAVSLRAVDQGVIQTGRPVSVVDEIFGTNFTKDLPVRKATEIGIIYFGTKVVPPTRPDEKLVAIGYTGWSMKIMYDYEGTIQYYSLSNLWKGHSSFDAELKGRTSIDGLRRLYERAASESERFSICLRDIDEGAIQTFGPVSNVDALFGTTFGSNLPSGKRGKQIESHSFASSSVQGRNQLTGWILYIEYKNDGSISDYYLTNLRTKQPQR